MNTNNVITINNFKIILNYDKNAKITQIDSYINTGFIYENKNNSGISHLLEHIIIDGWKKCNPSCYGYWKKKGASLNASTGQTYVNYYINGLTKYIYEMLEYIISISLNPILTETRLKKERTAVHNELLIHKTHPSMKLYDSLNKHLFNIEGLQYQDDVDLQISNLKKINLANLKQWSKKFYTGGNIIFLITGHFQKKNIEKFLKKKLPVKSINVIQPDFNVFTPGLIVKHVKNDNIDNSTIFFTFHSALSQKDDAFCYFEIFKKFINSSSTSILMEELREKQKLIYSISVEKYFHTFGNYFIIEISTKNDNIKKVIMATLNILIKISNGEFTNKYLGYVKESFAVRYYNTCQKPNFISSYIGEQYIHQIANIDNAKIFTYEEMLEKINKVDRITIINYIKKILTFGNLKLFYQGKNKIKNLLPEVQRKIL